MNLQKNQKQFLQFNLKEDQIKRNSNSWGKIEAFLCEHGPTFQQKSSTSTPNMHIKPPKNPQEPGVENSFLISTDSEEIPKGQIKGEYMVLEYVV